MPHGLGTTTPTGLTRFFVFPSPNTKLGVDLDVWWIASPRRLSRLPAGCSQAAGALAGVYGARRWSEQPGSQY